MLGYKIWRRSYSVTFTKKYRTADIDVPIAAAIGAIGWFLIGNVCGFILLFNVEHVPQWFIVVIAFVVSCTLFIFYIAKRDMKYLRNYYKLRIGKKGIHLFSILVGKHTISWKNYNGYAIVKDVKIGATSIMKDYICFYSDNFDENYFREKLTAVKDEYFNSKKLFDKKIICIEISEEDMDTFLSHCDEYLELYVD
ncbi:MAG: hypothetical protein J6B34_04535 [Clostridia bacterium]|nr:hypothetical protein [Clostridia bacterium]